MTVLCSLLALGPPAAAADRLVIEDPRDDANLVNTQGERGFRVDAPAPAGSRADADILSVTFSPLMAASEQTGFLLSVRFAAAPGEELAVGLVADLSGPACDEFFVTHERGPQGHRHTSLTGACGEVRPHVVLPDAVVVGSTLQIQVPYAVLPRGLAPGVTVGGPVGGIHLGVRNRVGAAGVFVTPGTWDTAATEETFRL